MVHALIEPSGFGKYFLEGMYENWKGYVKRFEHEDGSILEDEWPEIFVSENAIREIADLAQVGLWTVSQRVKDLVEELEPNVHQFNPIKVEELGYRSGPRAGERGKVYPHARYTMVIRTFLDSFDPDESSEGSWYFKSAYRVAHNQKNTSMVLP